MAVWFCGQGPGGRGGGRGGALHPCLGIGVPLGVWNPDPVLDENNFKYLPCVGQRPLF